jgi:hypothetical protein
MTTFERHYTPNELAALWSFSPKQIRRLFERMPGVVILNRPATRNKRLLTLEF